MKNFQSFAYRLSIHEIALFGRSLGPYSPIWSNIAEILNSGSTLANKNTVWKFFEGFDYLLKTDGLKVGPFSPTMTPLFFLTMVKTKKNSSAEKLQPLSYPNMSKWSLYLISLFREKYDYFLQYLGYFYQKTGRGHTSK